MPWVWEGSGLDAVAKLVEEHKSDAPVVPCQKCKGIATALYQLTNIPGHSPECAWWNRDECDCGARFTRYKLNMCAKCALGTDNWRRAVKTPDGSTVFMRTVARCKVAGPPSASYAHPRASRKQVAPAHVPPRPESLTGTALDLALASYGVKVL